MKITLPPIRHDRRGFETLVLLHAQTENCFLNDNIEIDMTETTWFDADMCAAFGAILYNLGAKLNTVRLTNIPHKVQNILSRNGFLSHYGRNRIPDDWGSITYQRFDTKDDRFFSGYIEYELIYRSEMPKMSLGLLKKFRESIFEIFSNAVLHSRTKRGIFSCGQFFYNRNKLDFTVADLGVGMCENIKTHTGLNFSPEEAIEWATKGNNTTKRGNVPGGLGLKLLGEFVDLNGGCIQIVSDAGYWQRKNRQTFTARLSERFPGTVVSVEINTADTASYGLTSEINAADIF